MAEINTDPDLFNMDFKSLYCSICHCIFSKPKILPCQHSFCHHCLKSYILSKARKLRTGQKLVEFPCPLCHMAIQSKKGSLLIGEWAGTFPTNYTIISITDELLSKKDRKQKRPACTVHRNKRVKFFCGDCNSLLCSLCTAKAHKTCHTVQTLSEAVSEIMDTKSQLSKQLITRKSELEEVCSHLKELRTSMVANKQKIVREIQNETEFIGRLLQELREGVREVMNELENLYSVNQLALGETLTKCESTIDSINFCQNLIDQNTLKEVGDAAFLQGVSAANRKYKQLPDMVPAAANCQVLIFQPNSSLQQQLQHLVKRPLGKVFLQQSLVPEDQRSDGNASVVPTEAGSTLTEAIADMGSAVFLSNFSTITTMYNSLIIDVALLPDSFLAVTDSLSCKVKIFAEDGELVKQVTLDNPPWGVCRLIQGEVAVTVPSKKNITYLSYIDTLCVRRKAITTKRYLGIVALNERVLVCASAASSCVDIISTLGDIYQSFSRNFVHPTYIALTKEHNILVTDSYKKSVICCDPHGNELFQYIGREGKGLTEPAGICTNRQGSVFVADAKNHNIYKIRILPLLTNIQQLSLTGLAISPDNKLVLTHSNENKVSGISIFHD